MTPLQERRLEEATKIMQGILSRENPITASECIKESIFYADRLIKAEFQRSLAHYFRYQKQSPNADSGGVGLILRYNFT
jgi:hypothetical protein